MITVVDLYTIQIVCDDGPFQPINVFGRQLKRMIAETEENLTDLLPPGYRARIRRWDNPDEPTQEAQDE